MIKRKLTYISLAIGAVMGSACTPSQHTEQPAKENRIETALPLSNLPLNDMQAFRPVDKNWQIVGDVFVDRAQKRTLITSPGAGVLANTPVPKKHKDNLFTQLEHGDIEIEYEVMMPVHSNSGVYFQGRYEVQLLDSWGVKQPKHSDIGGIYQRWDNTKEKGQRGFGGIPPRVNAAKAPGLWQKFKVIFHAPRFDHNGNKIKNAWFEEVWLNGELIHQNEEVSEPTRAAAFNDEKPLGPLMIQGDHGPVALRNIRYKLYENKQVELKGVKLKEYENTAQQIPATDTLNLLRELPSDSLSAWMATGQNPQRLLEYKGKLSLPNDGNYLFQMRVHRGGALLLVAGDTIVNLNGDYNINDLQSGKVNLPKGEHPFTLYYNKHRPYQRGFELWVEGPGIQKHPLHAPGSLQVGGSSVEPIVVQPGDRPALQRSFVQHGDSKRTHTVSVGTPQDIHYTFDMAYGSLIQAWYGDFLETTKMWHARGHAQLGEPLRKPLLFHGQPDFAILQNDNSAWPQGLEDESVFTHEGYQLDRSGLPAFTHRVGASRVTNKITPADTLRHLTRYITVDGNDTVWHKVAEGKQIEKLPDNTYAIDDKQYFIDFKSGNISPQIRQSNGTYELLVKLPKEAQEVVYNIIW